MTIRRSLLLKALVNPFYQQHAALLCFVFFMTTLAVGRANEVGLLEYHYSLIKGMMANPSFLATVLVIWLLYALKCMQFVGRTLQKAEFSWLYLLSQVNVGKLYGWLLLVQLVLFLPVLSYLFVMLGVGYHEHWYLPSNGALLFSVVICAASAWWYLYLLQRPGVKPFTAAWRLPSLTKRQPYTSFLFRYVLENNKVLLLVIKLYSCITLYLMLNDRDPAQHTDIRMMTLFYSIGMLGHGVLIHRLKGMENTALAFNRGLPVSIYRRFGQYAWFYLCMFIPEIIIIVLRTPTFLTYPEACFFIVLGYGILLLLNSLQLFNYTGLKDYLVTITQLLFAVIIAMVGHQLYVLSVIFFLLAIVVFYKRYYLFEVNNNNALQG